MEASKILKEAIQEILYEEYQTLKNNEMNYFEDIYGTIGDIQRLNERAAALKEEYVKLRNLENSKMIIYERFKKEGE